MRLLVLLLLMTPAIHAQLDDCEPPDCFQRAGVSFVHDASFTDAPIVGQSQEVTVHGFRGSDNDMWMELLVPPQLKVLGKTRLPVPEDGEFFVTFEVATVKEGFFTLRAMLIEDNNGDMVEGLRSQIGHSYASENPATASWDAFRLIRQGDLLYNVTAGRELDGNIWIDVLMWTSRDWRSGTLLNVEAVGTRQGEAAGTWISPETSGNGPSALRFNTSINNGETLELALNLYAGMQFAGSPGDRWQHVKVGCFHQMLISVHGPTIDLELDIPCNKRTDTGLVPVRTEFPRSELKEMATPPEQESSGLAVGSAVAVLVAAMFLRRR